PTASKRRRPNHPPTQSSPRASTKSPPQRCVDCDKSWANSPTPLSSVCSCLPSHAPPILISGTLVLKPAQKGVSMPDNQDSVNRRDFMVKTAAVAGAFGAAKELFAKPARAAATGRVIGANDRINVGVIGVGGRGAYLAGQYAAIGERTSACKVVAVADVYEKRKRLAVEKFKCDGYLDYREIINRADIDAVVVATPDHWHAPIALEALDHGKDVYLEKPMCHTIEEARHLSQTVKAPKRPFDADRFFRFRKYWDYSGGIATDLFFHVVAPLNICWSEPQFPSKVSASGGIYVFKDEREVPDTFHLMAEFPQGHSLVLSSTMANSHHIPGLIRGHQGTIQKLDHGMFEGRTDHITLLPERRVIDDAYKAKFGDDAETKIPIEQKGDPIVPHITNFLDCMRTREKPTLDVDTGFHAQVTFSMAVMWGTMGSRKLVM